MHYELLLRYTHFICILSIAATLASEYALLKPQLTRRDIGRLSRIDFFYGLSSMLLLAAGLTLWLTGIGKPADFYSYNWVFQLKLGLFVVLGLVSIHPTVFFMRQRKGPPEEQVPIPRSLLRCVQIELLLLLLIPLCASTMARGIGYLAH